MRMVYFSKDNVKVQYDDGIVVIVDCSGQAEVIVDGSNGEVGDVEVEYIDDLTIDNIKIVKGGKGTEIDMERLARIVADVVELEDEDFDEESLAREYYAQEEDFSWRFYDAWN
ncbi:MAG: hypothetical protein HUK20_08790 [Fibrobacter sp.]|nr:hypothetical protein [Fibrobacter sp.]